MIDAEQMRFLAQLIDQMLLGKWGFTLLVFQKNKPGIANYISNAQRSDMILGLRETADRLEKGEDFHTPESN